jgi:hypothetical protein
MVEPSQAEESHDRSHRTGIDGVDLIASDSDEGVLM